MIIINVFQLFTWSIFLLCRFSENVTGLGKLLELFWRDGGEAGEQKKASVQFVEDVHDSFRFDA